jgi:hypothetical protein
VKTQMVAEDLEWQASTLRNAILGREVADPATADLIDFLANRLVCVLRAKADAMRGPPPEATVPQVRAVTAS